MRDVVRMVVAECRVMFDDTVRAFMIHFLDLTT